MIYGIGVDLVRISRMEDVLRRWNEKFTRRVFTENEAAYCLKRAFPSPAFAMRFAAKEAFSKALGLGMKNGLRWREIEVFHHPGGRPALALHGNSLRICREKGVSRIHLSLSDEGNYAVAMVVLESKDETGYSG